MESREDDVGPETGKAPEREPRGLPIADGGAAYFAERPFPFRCLSNHWMVWPV